MNRYTTFAFQRLTYSEKKEKGPSQIMSGSGSTVTLTTPDSIAVGMILSIPEAVFTSMEASVQIHQFNTNPTGYVEVSHAIINEILKCNNMSNEIESL